MIKRLVNVLLLFPVKVIVYVLCCIYLLTIILPTIEYIITGELGIADSGITFAIGEVWE